MHIAIKLLQSKITEIEKRIKSAEQIAAEPELLSDYEFAMNEIANYEIQIMKILWAIDIIQKNLISFPSLCKKCNNNGGFITINGYETCTNCTKKNQK